MSISINGTRILFTRFPNNETNCNARCIEKSLDAPFDGACIEMKFESNEDLIHLMFVKSFLDDENRRATLKINYFPYSRMDRAMGESLFTLKYVTNFINSMKFDKVTILDAHSDVTPALINKSVNQYITLELFDKICTDESIKSPVVFFPDQGACKKYSKMFNAYHTAFGVKERDLATGEIIKYNAVGNVLDKDIVIIDDLCSGGRTFELAASSLREMGARSIYLIVSHCEVNIFRGTILSRSSDIEKVYTTNSIIPDNYHGKVYEKLCVIEL